MKNHYSHYLKLRRKEKDPPVIIYLKDENGNPILNYDKISIMNLRIEGRRVELAFDSKNKFAFIRYEVLSKYPELLEFKKAVDNKISELESKLDEE